MSTGRLNMVAQHVLADFGAQPARGSMTVTVLCDRLNIPQGRWRVVLWSDRSPGAFAGWEE
jgi:hypothetical protein